MRMRSYILLAICLVLLAPTLVFAGQSCTMPTTLVGDGRLLDFDFVPPSGDDYYEFQGLPGRSYSVEVRQDYDDANPDLAVVVAAYSAASCPTTFTELAGDVDTTNIDPIAPAGAKRVSFIVPGSGTTPNNYVVWIHNINASTGRYVSASVTNTTLFSPRWAKFTGYFTAWGFQNLSNATITGTFNVYNAAGAVAATENFTGGTAIPAGGTNFRDTQNSPNFTGLSGSGTASFAFIGPPGAIQADAFIDSTSGLFIQPIKFERHER